MSYLEEQLVLDFDTWTPLMHATSKDNFAKVKELIENGADIMETSQNGNTVLHVACMYSIEAFDLYKDFFHPDVQNKMGISPLMILADTYCNHRDYMLYSLLKKGADVNLRDYQNKTALIHAIENEQGEMAMELEGNYTACELDWDVTDNFGKTPFSLALAQKDFFFATYIASRIMSKYKRLSNDAKAIPIMKNENDLNTMNTFNPLQK